MSLAIKSKIELAEEPESTIPELPLPVASKKKIEFLLELVRATFVPPLLSAPKFAMVLEDDDVRLIPPPVLPVPVMVSSAAKFSTVVLLALMSATPTPALPETVNASI